MITKKKKVILKFQNIKNEKKEEIDIIKNEIKEAENEINASENQDIKEISNNDIINVTFNFIIGSKVVISAPGNMSLEDLFNNFAKKSGIIIFTSNSP